MATDRARASAGGSCTDRAAAFAELRLQALRDVTAIFADMSQAIDDLSREVVADLDCED